jgi:hypothetical protein
VHLQCGRCRRRAGQDLQPDPDSMRSQTVRCTIRIDLARTVMPKAAIEMQEAALSSARPQM